MRLGLLATLIFICACPPPKKPIPEPEPTGRCDVDLAALNHFASVGTGVSAKQVTDVSQLIGGNYAQGRIGDFVLQNDRIRVVIQQPSRTIGPVPYGGTIIDADLQRSTGSGRDEFGKMGPIYAFGRTVNVSKVEVLNDGERGGYAVIAASGTDAVVDYVNVKNVISDFLGNVQLVRDPDVPLPFLVTTYYVLSPGESRVRVLSAFCNQGKETISMQIGDLLEQGGVTEVFNPDGCTNGLGVGDCLVDPMSWFGYQADQVAYGYRTYKFNETRTPGSNALLYIAGIGAVLADGENQQGLLTWVDENATRRPGSFGVLAGDKRTFLRDFFVGRDLGEIKATMLAIDGAAKSRLTVTVQKADGSPAPGARVTVKVAESGRMATLLVADDQGIAKSDLTPGNYLVGSAARGTKLEALTAVSVPSGGDASITVHQGGSHTLTVNVRDPFNLPLSAKVMVRCTNPPCTDQQISYRPFIDVESQPSDLQAVTFAGADGRATIPLPPGEYEVMVTRGMEYSAFPDTFPTLGQRVDLRTADVNVDATIAKVVDSTGWMSADLHVHAMNSPDSAVGNAVRAMSFAAEGVDVLVSTDHDYITDYAPVIDQLQLGSAMASMIGCEVTPFDYGHHNTFPLVRQPLNGVAGGAVDWAGGDGASLRLGQMYEAIRARDPNTLIQMNHPRGSPGGSLTMLKVDTATGFTHADPALFRQEPHPEATAMNTKLFDPTFDAIEVMNGTSPNTGVINDWMTFMSRGWLKVATGVSDTHYTYNVVGGYGRTWVKLGVDSPAQFTPEAFTTAMKARKASFSSGPFITMTAQKLDSGGMPTGPVFDVGDTVSLAAGQSMRLTVDVQAPEWMQFDSIEVHTHVDGREALNGEANSTLKPAQAALKKTYDPTMLPLEPVPGLNGFNARRVHLTETFDVTASADTWFVAMARASSASRTLAPMAWDDVNCSGGICTPTGSRGWAITNAILVDADGSGAYDDFPLKPTQPLMATPAVVERGPRRVPSADEFAAWLRKLKHHGRE
ncbi:MAG: CehA/McbA family metallohydrolase [Archangium sp.]